MDVTDDEREIARQVEHALVREGWAPGPWDSEPDRDEFEAHGLLCRMVRVEYSGTWNGYVGVPEGHPAHGKGYDTLDVDVHGGLTYSDQGFPPGLRDRHDLWVLGFDTGHGGDFAPGIEASMRKHNPAGPAWNSSGIYRDMAYVRAQVMGLARQLADMGAKPDAP